MYTQYQVPVASERINLGVGQPSPKLLKDSLLALNRSLANNVIGSDPAILQYGNISGFPDYKKMICDLQEIMTGDDLTYPENIFMTNGISQAVFMLASLLKKQGYTKVYVEDPTYFLMLNIFKDLDYEIELFNLTEYDTLHSGLYDNLYRDHANNKRVLIYIIPFNHNPTGRTIRKENIKDLKLICNNFPNNLILSDETYQFLNFDLTQNQQSLVSQLYGYNNVISMGTFSKLIAPSLRLGWINTQNKELHNLLNTCGFMDSGGSVNQVVARLVCDYVKENDIVRVIKKTVEFLKNNCDKLCYILDRYREYFSYEKPNGGYFIWVKHLQFDGKKFQEICMENKLNFHLGNKFSANPDTNTEYFRLSFSYYDYTDYDYFSERLEKSIYDYKKKYDKITINILGGNGRLGSLICQEAEKNYIVNKLNRKLDNIIVNHKSVIIDVSSIDGNKTLLETLIRENYKVPLIIGTTGILDYELIDKYAKMLDNYNHVIVSSNFSIGVASINKFIDTLHPDYWTANLEEHHHIHKKDKPSGTALKFKNLLNSKILNPDCDVTSVREGEIIGYHKICLTTDYEEITIIHNAKDRRLFAKGCLEIAKSIFKA